MDLEMLYDGFVEFVWYELEFLGFCGTDQGYEFTRHGRAQFGGLPVNTFGGDQGDGRFHGMGHIREAAMQIMGRGGERQVPNEPQYVLLRASSSSGA